MPDPDYYVRQGDTGISVSDTLLDASGNPVSIQGASIRFDVVPVGGGAALVSTTATNAQTGDGSDGSKGKVGYTWTGTQTSLSGWYLGSWIATFGGGAVQTYPNGGYLLIEISPDAPTSQGTSYVQLEELKGTLELSSSFADQDIIRALDASSRRVDAICGRRFWLDADANQKRYFSALDPGILFVDDLVTVTTLKSDSDRDGTYETTWTVTTDYRLQPLNAAADGEPYSRVESVGKWFPTYASGIEITGKFGWPSVPAPVKQATTLMANRLLKRAREVPFGVAGMGFDGSVVRIPAADPDVLELLGPYVKPSIQ